MTTVVYCQMSEAIDPGLELIERQNRFVNEHLRRIFVQIYRIVRNRADAQDLTQETFIKALQRQDQLKDDHEGAGFFKHPGTINNLPGQGRVLSLNKEASQGTYRLGGEA